MDTALTEMGGFGRHQRITWAIYSATLAFGSYVLYPMGYYELFPKFKCDGTPCEVKEICNKTN